MEQEKLILNLIKLLEEQQTKFTSAVNIAINVGTDKLNRETESLLRAQSKLLAEVNAAMEQTQTQKIKLKVWAKIIGITAVVSILILACGIYGIRSVTRISDYREQNDKLVMANKELQLKSEQSEKTLQQVLKNMNELPCSIKVAMSQQWYKKSVKCRDIKFSVRDE